MADQQSSQHGARILWTADNGDSDGDYSTNHQWQFPGGESLNGSAAESFGGNPDFVDPEQGLVAALSSCHMLTFLALAHKFGHRVLRYEDNASGEIGRGEGGIKAVTRITLNPVVEFADGKAPDEAGLAKLHASAHKYCFISNSLKSDVVINH